MALPNIVKNVACVFGSTTYAATIIKDSKPSSIKAAGVDVSSMGSTAREFLPEQIPDNGSFELKIYYDGITNVPVVGGPTQLTKLQYPQPIGSQQVGDAFIEELTPESPWNGVYVASVKFKWTGGVQNFPL